jgi:hypothetical protein
MCPACMTSIALIAAGGTSASGLAVLALTRFSARKRTRVRPRKLELKGESSRARRYRHADAAVWKGNSGGKSSWIETTPEENLN